MASHSTPTPPDFDDFVTLDVFEGRWYEIAKTNDSEYAYRRKEDGKPTVSKRLVVNALAGAPVSPEALEVLGAILQFAKTKHPLIDFLPELSRRLMGLFTDEELSLETFSVRFRTSLASTGIEGTEPPEPPTPLGVQTMQTDLQDCIVVEPLPRSTRHRKTKKPKNPLVPKSDRSRIGRTRPRA
jgi:hypothetical protein